MIKKILNKFKKYTPTQQENVNNSIDEDPTVGLDPYILTKDDKDKISYVRSDKDDKNVCGYCKHIKTDHALNIGLCNKCVKIAKNDNSYIVCGEFI